MARSVVPLTDSRIRSVKPTDKEQSLFDGGGLFLLVSPSGSKRWKFRYKYQGKMKKITIGEYPIVSLKAAREKRAEFREMLAIGDDPARAKNKSDAKILNEVAEELEDLISESVTEKYKKKLFGYYNVHVRPYLGTKDISKIDRLDIIDVMDAMKKKGIYESANKTLNLIERMLKYAVTKGYADRNVVADLDKSMLLKKIPTKHRAALTDEKDIAVLMHAIEEYANPLTKNALRLSAHLALRPKEIRCMKWEYVDLENRKIVIPAEEMKMREEHIVPISDQVMGYLEELRSLSGKDVFVFPNSVYYDRCMSENTVNTALRRLGFEKEDMTAHGFRSMFSTIAHEKSGFSHDVIESALAHSVGSSVSRAYNRAKHLKERAKLMQWWSDHLCALRESM